MDYSATHHPAVLRYLRGLFITPPPPFRPSPREIFDIPTLYAISQQCKNLSDPILFRSIFLVSFYAFLKMSNVAPDSSRQFEPSKHLLRQDVVFTPPGSHMVQNSARCKIYPHCSDTRNKKCMAVYSKGPENFVNLPAFTSHFPFVCQ